jgi:hypothetical protein
MGGTPEQTQARFLADIAPELHRKAELLLYEEEPGHLSFSDGIVDSMALAANRDAADCSLLRRVTGSRIRVDLDAELTGTKVTIRGRVERQMRGALELLGEPGHWPDASVSGSPMHTGRCVKNPESSAEGEVRAGRVPGRPRS